MYMLLAMALNVQSGYGACSLRRRGVLRPRRVRDRSADGVRLAYLRRRQPRHRAVGGLGLAAVLAVIIGYRAETPRRLPRLRRWALQRSCVSSSSRAVDGGQCRSDRHPAVFLRLARARRPDLSVRVQRGGDAGVPLTSRRHGRDVVVVLIARRLPVPPARPPVAVGARPPDHPVRRGPREGAREEHLPVQDAGVRPRLGHHGRRRGVLRPPELYISPPTSCRSRRSTSGSPSSSAALAATAARCSVGILYVAIQHGVFGMDHPEAVYNHPDAIANPMGWGVCHACSSSGSARRGSPAGCVGFSGPSRRGWSR